MAPETRPFDSSANTLLTPDDQAPVAIVNPNGGSSFLLIGDHAGNELPVRLAGLGLSPADRGRHIALDIGVQALGKRLSGILDATFIHQRYSRLAVDCNRDHSAVDVIATVSDGTVIPGNQHLRAEDRDARFAEIYRPYHSAIEDTLALRDTANLATMLVALHSFTPMMASRVRPWEIGVLHDRGNTAFALACLQSLRSRGDVVVGDNEPYRMDHVDYTIPRHAYPNNRPYVEIELRQDLLSDAGGVDRWAGILEDTLMRSATTLGLPAVVGRLS